jgi:hypothetical protein
MRYQIPAPTYEGKPCNKCGRTTRYTSNIKCVVCRREDNAARAETPTPLDRKSWTWLPSKPKVQSDTMCDEAELGEIVKSITADRLGD